MRFITLLLLLLQHASAWSAPTEAGLVGCAAGAQGDGFPRLRGRRTTRLQWLHFKVVSALRRVQVARVEWDEVEMPGGCQGESIGAALKAATPGVEHCYEKALARRPWLTGDITMALTPDGSGGLKVELHRASMCGAVAGCVVRQVRRSMEGAPGDCAGQVTVGFRTTLRRPGEPTAGTRGRRLR